MALAQRKSQTTARKASSDPTRIRKDFGAIIAEVYVSKKGKSAGQVRHAIRHKDHFWVSLNLDFVASMDASGGVQWGKNVESAFVWVDQQLADAKVIEGLEKAYAAETGDDEPKTGGLASRMKSRS